MPNPRTGAEWAKKCQHTHGVQGGLLDAMCRECADAYARQQVEPLETEIRRLREAHEWATNNINTALNKIDTLKADLAAHRAVVRELAESLEAWGTGKDSAGQIVCHVSHLLAHSLVQQAREEKR